MRFLIFIVIFCFPTFVFSQSLPCATDEKSNQCVECLQKHKGKSLIFERARKSICGKPAETAVVTIKDVPTQFCDFSKCPSGTEPYRTCVMEVAKIVASGEFDALEEEFVRLRAQSREAMCNSPRLTEMSERLNALKAVAGKFDNDTRTEMGKCIREQIKKNDERIGQLAQAGRRDDSIVLEELQKTSWDLTVLLFRTGPQKLASHGSRLNERAADVSNILKSCKG